MADRGDPGMRASGAAGHEAHDLERIASLLDTDLSAADRMAGEAMAAACPDCARLRDDLFALAGVTGAMATPERTRDFRLTPADAARLAPIGPEEPFAGPTRLGNDMFDPRITAGHAAHDTMLVAALVDHSVPTSDRDAAQRMVDTCRLCAELHADLLALRAATRALPTSPRPRDYFLSAADAERLRPSGLRRWLMAIGSSRDAITRPLAIGLTTLGIIGLLFSGAPLISFDGAARSAAGGSAAAVPQPASTQPAMDVAAPAGGNGVVAPAPSAVAAPAGAEATGAANADAAASAAPVKPPAAQLPGSYPGPSGGPTSAPPEFLGDQGVLASGAKASAPLPGRQPDRSVAASGSQPAAPEPAVPPVVALSVILLAVGLGLFLLRWMARRVGT